MREPVPGEEEEEEELPPAHNAADEADEDGVGVDVDAAALLCPSTAATAGYDHTAPLCPSTAATAGFNHTRSALLSGSATSVSSVSHMGLRFK